MTRGAPVRDGRKEVLRPEQLEQPHSHYKTPGTKGLTFTPEEAAAAMDMWLERPDLFARDVLRVDMWEKQVEIAMAVRDHPRVSVCSCNAIGKDFTAAQVVLWWIAMHERCMVVVLAPTWHQLYDLTFREIHASYNRSLIPFGGRLNKVGLELGEGRRVIGLATDRKERIMGIHAENLLVVVTEASGMNEEVMEGAETLAAGGNARLLLLGNPTAEKGTFYRSHHDLKDMYFTLQIGWEDTPNFKAGRDERPYLITWEWVTSRKRKWGLDSPLYEIHVEGRFPRTSADGAIPYEWAAAAGRRYTEQALEPRRRTHRFVVGIDVSRGGEAETVVQRRVGPWFANPEVYQGIKTSTAVRDIIRNLVEKENPDRIYVDATGLGGAIVDECWELGYYQVEPVYTGSGANDPKVYGNLRAELWFLLRRWLQPDNEEDEENLLAAIPNDETLIAQLAQPHYHYNPNGKIVLESKQDMRKRGLDSPDRADALVLTFMEDLVGAGGTSQPGADLEAAILGE